MEYAIEGIEDVIEEVMWLANSYNFLFGDDEASNVLFECRAKLIALKHSGKV